MFDVCPHCGLYSPEKSVVADNSDAIGTGAFAICPQCSHQIRFLRMPLFLVTGASSAGKTTVSEVLPALLPECVVLEGDILWRKEFDTPGDNYLGFHSTWLRLAKNIQQGGRPVVLCGTVLPSHLEGQVQRRYFGQLHFLALVCKDERALRERLERRPDWRYGETDRGAYVNRMLEFNTWLQENADKTRPPMTVLDASTSSKEEVTSHVREWVLTRLGTHQPRRP